VDLSQVQWYCSGTVCCKRSGGWYALLMLFRRLSFRHNLQLPLLLTGISVTLDCHSWQPVSSSSPA
jgi:hypothetical protein